MKRAQNSVLGPKIPIWKAPLIGFNKDSNFEIAGLSDGERLFFWQSFDDVSDGDDNGDFYSDVDHIICVSFGNCPNQFPLPTPS